MIICQEHLMPLQQALVAGAVLDGDVGDGKVSNLKLELWPTCRAFEDFPGESG